MSEMIWDDVLTKNDREVITRGGYGKRRGAGEKIALLVIDPQLIYVGEDQPILESITKWPSGTGERAWRAVEKTCELIEIARQNKIPIFYTKNVTKYLEFDSFAKKANRRQDIYMANNAATDFVEIVKPLEGEFVIEKSYASAFYGTPLPSYLNKLRVDTLLVCGGTTGGCVRATVVDAVTRNFNVALVEECLFDRIEISHKVALLDMWMKYADLLKFEEASELIRDETDRMKGVAKSCLI